MSDLNPTTEMKLGEALRALPLATPGRDGWPALAAQLASSRASARRPRRAWRYGVPLALAAGLALALVVPHLLRRSPSPSVTTIATVAPATTSSTVNGAIGVDAANMTNATNIQTQEGAEAQLAAAQTRSQALERWLRDTRHAASPLPSQDLVAASEIENLIGLVDVELASVPTRALPLWQRRVALLEDLTALRYSNYRLAETASTTASIDTLNRLN